jgi:hypothetical protein
VMARASSPTRDDRGMTRDVNEMMRDDGRQQGVPR